MRRVGNDRRAALAYLAELAARTTDERRLAQIREQRERIEADLRFFEAAREQAS